MVYFFFLTLFVYEIKAKDFSDLQWKNRVLIASTFDETQLKKISKFQDEYNCQISTRNLKFVIFKNNKNTNYDTPDFIVGTSGFWLIGYDGTLKAFFSDTRKLEQIFDLIDQMPIRKKEMIDSRLQC